MQHYGLLIASFIRSFKGTIQFTPPTYNSKSITGLIGSSVNFTWTFTGTVGIHSQWGPMTDDGSNINALVTILSNGDVTLPPHQSPYNGRVNGSRSGTPTSGKVIFILKSITKVDERVFGCEIYSSSGFDDPSFDYVSLVVQGKLNFSLFFILIVTSTTLKAMLMLVCYLIHQCTALFKAGHV